MKIRAILRFRNEDFTRKRMIAGFKTQKELADSLGINPMTISMWETFKSYPKKERLIKAIEVALNCDIDEIFPPEFIEAIHKKIGIPFEKIIDLKQLPEYTRGEYLLPSPEKAYELKELAALQNGDMAEEIETSLNCLTEREADVLKMRFGLGNSEEQTLEKVGEYFHVGRERIRQIEAKALRKLESYSKSGKLRSFLKEAP